MRMMCYSVSDTGILGNKSECSYQELLPNIVVTLFTITSVGNVFGDGRSMSEMSVYFRCCPVFFLFVLFWFLFS